MQLAFVLWSGALGGAETFVTALADRFRGGGVDVRLLFVRNPGPLTQRLDALGLPWTALRYPRGTDVLRRAYRFADAVTEVGPDGALLVASGIMARGLKHGGYTPRTVAVEHGNWLQLPEMPIGRRLKAELNYLLGARAADVQVAVSDYMLREIERRPHAATVTRIYNGIDLGKYRPSERHGGRNATSRFCAGYAGRLAPGKGVLDILNALTFVEGFAPKLRIAGDGPLRPSLEAEVKRLGLSDRVSFLGWVNDLTDFWAGCDLAIVPSNGLIESFCLSAVEAMACGKPVLASRAGALPEIADDEVTGALFPPGDSNALAGLLQRYAADPKLVLTQGRAGVARCRALFDLDAIAASYLRLFGIEP